MKGTEFARLSGTYSTAYIGTYELLSQSSSSLTSTFKLRGYFYYGGGTQASSTGTHNFYLDGTKIKSGSSYSYTPGYHKLGETTITVEHNPDGSFPDRSVTISASGQTHMNGSAKGNITGIADIVVIPPEIIPVNSVVAYIKKGGTWHRGTAFLKNGGVFKKIKEFYKEMGEWQ